MKIETEPRDDHQVKLTAEFEPEVTDKYKHQAARKIAKEAKIPGFRPGKAPYDVVRRLYGDKLIEEQAVELLVDDLYPQILKEAGVEPSGAGQLENIISMDPPKFSFIVPLAPEIKLADYHAMRQDYAPEAITDEDVTKVFRNLQTGSATAEPAERPAQDGDLVYAKVSGTLTEPAEGEDSELIKETPLQIIIGENNPDPDDFPFEGFSKQLIGMAPNEVKKIPYTYPEDSKYEKLRGKKVEFTLTVESVKAMKLPELNDEFAQSMGDFASLDDLRKNIQTQLEVNRANEYDQKYLNEFIDSIVKESTIAYPPQMLAEEEEDILHDIEHDLSHQQLDLETYLKTRQLEKDAFIETEVKPSAKKRLERSLVLEQIAQAEKIELDRKELEAAVIQNMQQLQSQPDQPKARNNTEKRNLTNAVTIQTANQLLNRQIMNRLKAIGSGKFEPTLETASEAPAVDLPAAEASAADAPVAEPPVEEKNTPELPTGEEQVPPEKPLTE
ncbi:MAG: trigger factor [Anaerolineaceae bacterium]|nr:trigger factor [Anaerolineaceae bacterium]